MDVRGAGRVPAGGDGDEVERLPVRVSDGHVDHLAQAAKPPFTGNILDRTPVGFDAPIGRGLFDVEDLKGYLEGACSGQRAVLQLTKAVLLGEPE